LSTSVITLVAHSPLLRARQTSEGMLGCMAPDTKASPVERVLELDLLAEKTPSEWTPMYFSQFKTRIFDFEKWLGEQSDDKVAIVGHSQYFKAMLGLDFKFGNCDVWQVTFDISNQLPQGGSNVQVTNEESAVSETPKRAASDNAEEWTLPPQWSDLRQLYKCEVEGSKKD
jgi:phosphohistidine phosphatase SixA